MFSIKSVFDSGLKVQSGLSSFIRNSCYRASLNRIKRPAYARLYPVTLVKPDGSSITIKYHEPISIIKLPYDLNLLSDIDRKRRMLKRQMSGKTDKKQASLNEEIIDKTTKFDPKKYLIMNKKK